LQEIGVHAPEQSFLGKTLSVIVMDPGAVISAHMESSPSNVTISVLTGCMVCLVWIFSENSPILSMSGDVDMLADSTQVRELVMVQRFKCFVYRVPEVHITP
jgi:hypothetical protein